MALYDEARAILRGKNAGEARKIAAEKMAAREAGDEKSRAMPKRTRTREIT
jgi:hypothetical protein